nr:transposase family protein [Sporosarcina limicola]
MLLLMVILKNVCNSETMRGMTNQFNKEVCISNFQTVLGLKNLEELPHYDTINNFLSELNLVEVENIRTYMIKELFKKRCFDNHKINGKDWGVIVDGTGLFCFDKKHCEHCLKRVFRNKETGEVEYMHHVLEAKLVVGNMVLSIGSEFIENESEDFDKQDCELNAFHRLAEKIKKTYNRLPICLLADSLYACEPVFKRCDQYKWNYMIRFKEGSIPSIAREFEALKKIEKENQSETICWVNEIAYKDRKLNVLEYRLLPKWVNKLATLTRSTCTSICKRVTLYQATDYSVIKTTEQITSTNPKLSYKRSA